MKTKIFNRNKESGQTLVEFALVAILFFILIFGILEFGRALWTWNTIVHVTREGARFAVVEAPSSTDIDIKKYVVYHDITATSSSEPVLPGLTTDNVTVQYLKYDGSTVGDENDCRNYSSKHYRLSISICCPDFRKHSNTPPFKTTLPLEGLGQS